MITSETIRCTMTDDGVVFLDVSNGNIFNSNAVGARIWLKLQEGYDPATIADQISAEFNVPIERTRPDVDELIEKLRANGMLAETSQQ